MSVGCILTYMSGGSKMDSILFSDSPDRSQYMQVGKETVQVLCSTGTGHSPYPSYLWSTSLSLSDSPTRTLLYELFAEDPSYLPNY